MPPLKKNPESDNRQTTIAPGFLSVPYSLWFTTHFAWSDPIILLFIHSSATWEEISSSQSEISIAGQKKTKTKSPLVSWPVLNSLASQWLPEAFVGSYHRTLFTSTTLCGRLMCPWRDTWTFCVLDIKFLPRNIDINSIGVQRRKTNKY